MYVYNIYNIYQYIIKTKKKEVCHIGSNSILFSLFRLTRFGK